MDSKKALYFRDEFREARAAALKDAEGYQQILFVLERFGAYMYGGGCCKKHDHKKSPGLGAYKNCVTTLVNEHHPLQGKPPEDYHTAFSNLYDMVKDGRNDAFHQGAVARSLTAHSVQLSLMLEDTFMTIMGGEIKNYMVRNPVCASEWQPVSFVRQMMLENSFSYIPVYMRRPGSPSPWPRFAHMKKGDDEREAWYIVADYHIEKYLRSAANGNCRKKLLAKPIKDAIGSDIEKALTARPNEPVKVVLGRTEVERVKGQPILVKRDNCKELLGIVTAHDLM